MLKQWLLKYIYNQVYVQIWENRLKVTDIKTKQVYFDEKPLIVVQTIPNQQAKPIVAIGNKAELATTSNTQIINPFSHPRMLLANFLAGEKVLQYTFSHCMGYKILRPKPFVIIHPMEKNAGGLTQVEKRAFHELALGAGAMDAVVYEGKELSIGEFDYKTIKSQIMQVI